MIDFKHKNLISVIPLTFIMVACATPVSEQGSASNAAYSETDAVVVTEDYNIDVIEYTVKRGDRLSSIAQEITGRSSTWQEIAEFNSISNPRKLLVGSVLAIPTDLIVGYESSSTALAPRQELNTVTPEAQSSSLAIRRNDAVEVPVIVTPINTNRNFELNPIDPNATIPSQDYKGAGTQIKVIGSYYPKGIYTEPAAYSELILRAAPGSLFLLDSKVNDWYKIETKSGSGYIRTSDAAIVENTE